MTFCKWTTGVVFSALVLSMAVEANAFFGRNHAMPSAMYFANYTNQGSYGIYDDPYFVAPQRYYSPFNTRFWDRVRATKTQAMPVIVEDGYSECIINGGYNAEFSSDCCAPAVDCCAPAVDCCAPAADCCAPAVDCCAPAVDCCAPAVDCCAPAVDCCYPAVDCCYPVMDYSFARRPFRPIRNTLKTIGSLLCPKRPVYDPCFSVCDPCFSVCDPCFACCDPCFSGCDTSCGFGVTQPCCGQNEADMLDSTNLDTTNGVNANVDQNSASTFSTEDPATTEPSLPSPENAPSIPETPPASEPSTLEQILPTNTPQTTNTGVIHLNVPADAIVYVNGYQTKLTGEDRNFTASNLIAGETYSFEVRVVAERNGQTFEQVQTTNLVAGSTSVLAFSLPKNINVNEEMVALR